MDKLYPVLGHSMRFLLEPGDAVRARPCAPEELRPGDIALLVKWAGGLPSGYVLHRVLLNLPGPAGRLLLTKGDANLLPDWPPGSYQPAGVALELRRGGLAFPLRRGVARSLLLPLYSLAANKLLYLAAALAASLFSALCRLRPAPFARQLNSLYLAWESSLYPALLGLLAGPAGPRGGSPAPAAASVRSGRIRSDETWSGRVAVADYLTIEKGARVTVLPGTEIVFERREPWFFPVLRAGPGGELLELESAGSKLLVYGELSAAGTTGAPVLFGGPAFAGVHALGGGKVELQNCLLAGSSACALSAWDRASLTALSCRLSSCARGAEVYGSALAVFEDCSVERASGAAFMAGDHASLLVYRGGAAACGGAAAELGGSAAAGFYNFSAAGCAAGLYLAGRAGARLNGCSVSGNSGLAASCAGASSLAAAGCSFSGNPAGLSASGENSVSFSSCAFSADDGPSARISGRNRAVFHGCSFSGGRGPSVQALGHNLLSMRDCSFSGGESGADFSGRGSLELSRCSFSGTGGAALRARRAASLQARSCTFSGCKAGLRAEDSALVSVSACVFADNAGPAAFITGPGAVGVAGSGFTGNGVGLHLDGESAARVSACRFGAQRGAPLILSGRVRCSLENSDFSGNASGAALSGRAAAEASGCSFRGNGGPSFELSGAAELKAGDTRSSGGPAALLMSGDSRASLSRFSAGSAARPAACLEGAASLYAESCSFSSVSDAVYARGRSFAGLDGCALSAGAGAALDLAGGSARLRGCRASGAGGLLLRGPASLSAAGLQIGASEYSVDSSGARLEFRSLRSRGGSRGGLLLSGGSAVLEGAAISEAPYPGLAAEGCALTCAGVTFDGAPWRPPSPRVGAPRLRPALARFAAATARLPGFSVLYRLFYLLAARAAGLALRPPCGGSVYLYRGMAAPGWVPGLSDMDLALLLPPSGGGWDPFVSLRRRLRVFRALFPFTGEVLSAPAAQFSAFVSGWGIKGAEFAAASRLLAGEPLPRPGRAAGDAPDRTEAFYAYTLLLSHFYDEALPAAFRTRNCLKGLADVQRYLDTASPQRHSRGAYAASRGLDLENRSSGAPAEAAFSAFSALHSAFPPAGRGRPAYDGPAGTFNRHAFGEACAALRASAGCDAGVVLDSLYRVYLVLPDAAAQDRPAFLRAARALREAGRASPYLSAAPLVLTRSAFAGLSALPYLNNPLFRLDLSLPPDGRSPEDGGVYAWNMETTEVPPAPELRTAAATAARHFSASWRSLWGSMPPHYFYTRAAGLRLLLRCGACPPFSRPSELSAAWLAAFGAGPSWTGFSAGGAGRANYEFVEEQCRALEGVAGED